MQFPKSLHAEGWHAHLPHLRLFHAHAHAHGDTSPRARRPVHLAIAGLALLALAASAGLAAADDPRPLDEQLSTAMQDAGDTLRQWQEALSHGLQVSLRAVADGRDLPGTAEARVAEVAPGEAALRSSTGSAARATVAAAPTR